jgi:hypothetical protein
MSDARDEDTPNSDTGQEEPRQNGRSEDRIREGRHRRGGVNDEPKTPRPSARPTPRTPPSSEEAEEDGQDG